MDPLSIATSVVGLTATCLSTCKKLHDLAGEYEDVPTILAMICSESTVISMGLSELQSKILRRDDLAEAWASRTDILSVFETALTGCMVVFSYLEAETRSLRAKNPGVLAKLKFVLNQDRLKELLQALRGQQTSITFLLNILEMDTLASIQKDIREQTRKIEATAAEAQSLRSRNPSIKMESQSIFDKDASRLSVFGAEGASVVAPSELDFQFDDLVINSDAYRRAFAKAHAEGQEQKKHVTDSSHGPGVGVKFELISYERDAPRGISQISLYDTIEASATDGGVQTESQPSSIEEAIEEEHQTVVINGSDSQELGFSQALSQLVCNRCDVDITGRCVKALGYAWHPNCFECYDCCEPVAGHFFASNEEENQDKPLCEKDYNRRLQSKCFKCDGALAGKYITAFRGNGPERSYHPQHFTCDECETVLNHHIYHTYKKGLYCELHFARNFALYCSGCKFPLIEGACLQSHDETGVEMQWHYQCFIMIQHWGFKFPTSPQGRQYLTTIQRGSMQDLLPQIREQHVACLQRMYQLGSYTLSTFATNLGLALQFREAGAGGKESFRHWRTMLISLSRLLQAAGRLSNDLVNAEVTSFSRTFHGFITDFALGSNDSLYSFNMKMSTALVPVLRVALKTLFEKDDVSWDAMPRELDDFLTMLDPNSPLRLNPDYDRAPTGRGVFLRCEECNEILTQDIFSESSEPGLKWHPECFRCLVCRSSEGVVSFPVKQNIGSYNCRRESCGWEGIVEIIPSHALVTHHIWRSWLLVKKDDDLTKASPRIAGLLDSVFSGITNRTYQLNSKPAPF